MNNIPKFTLRGFNIHLSRRNVLPFSLLHIGLHWNVLQDEEYYSELKKIRSKKTLGNVIGMNSSK